MFVLNGNAGRILRTLKACGLTEYESMAYFTLLLTQRSKIGPLSKKSSVPQSKIYWIMESLRDNGLVDIDEDFPKTATARRFEPYLSRAIDRKQKEVSEMVEAQTIIKDTIYSLQPVTIKYKDKYRVFEPKYLRRRRRAKSTINQTTTQDHTQKSTALCVISR